MKTRLVVLVIVAIIVGAFVVATRGRHHDDTSAKVKAGAHNLLSQVEGFEKDQAYYDSLLDTAHPAAFEQIYKIVYGRPDLSEFDTDAYLRAVFPMMIARAKTDGSTHIATSLDTFYRNDLFGADSPGGSRLLSPRK
jgi:hypothetical protein